MSNRCSLGSCGMIFGRGSRSTMVSLHTGELDQHACLLKQLVETVPDGVVHCRLGVPCASHDVITKGVHVFSHTCSAVIVEATGVVVAFVSASR